MTIIGTDRRRVRGHLQNVAPAAFVQMIAIERETCALAVREDGREGVLYFVVGDLWDARLGELVGEEAAVRILGWDLADVETRVLTEPPKRSIYAPLTFILLESMRRRDEGAREADTVPAGAPLPAQAFAALVCELDGVSGACLIDFSSGRPFEECSLAIPGLDPLEVIRACHEVARAGHLLVSKSVRPSSLEEIVLTFRDQLTLLHFLRADLLLAIIADPARTTLPAIRAAVRRLLPQVRTPSSWQE